MFLQCHKLFPWSKDMPFKFIIDSKFVIGVGVSDSLSFGEWWAVLLVLAGYSDILHLSQPF